MFHVAQATLNAKSHGRTPKTVVKCKFSVLSHADAEIVTAATQSHPEVLKALLLPRKDTAPPHQSATWCVTKLPRICMRVPKMSCHAKQARGSKSVTPATNRCSSTKQVLDHREASADIYGGTEFHAATKKLQRGRISPSS